MSKRNPDGTWMPGLIYELRHGDPDNDRNTFYVGETTNLAKRLERHRASIGTEYGEDAVMVYQFINELERHGLHWQAVIVAHYGSEGPGTLEDDYVVNALVRGCQLTNMRRGNAQWLEQLELESRNMRALGFTNREQYRQHQAAQALTLADVISRPTATKPKSTAGGSGGASAYERFPWGHQHVARHNIPSDYQQQDTGSKTLETLRRLEQRPEALLRQQRRGG